MLAAYARGVPTFLPPEDAHFDIRDGLPVLLLEVDAPHDVETDGWSLLNRSTLVVVDGPGDTGFLLPRMTAGGDAAPAGWDEAVERAGSVQVLFRDSSTIVARVLA
jgi:hypothetical protein